MSAVLLTRLKIADLAAWTALTAGRRLLPADHALARVIREELYHFEAAPGSSADAFEAPLSRAIATSNFFVNPNKESYRFLGSRSRGETLVPPDGAWGILTRSRDETRDDSLRTRLLREHPLEGLGAIRRARIWWLWTRGPAGDRAVEASYDALGRVTGPKAGLLVNPHAEADLRVDSALPWRSVEEFLTLPPPALGRAA
jgi:hypothetical protein